MDTLWQDIRYGIRMLFKNPGFTIVALLTLSLGIGANTAIFSIVNALLLRPLPYKDPDRVVMVWQDFTKVTGREREWTSPDTFFDWRDQNHVFEGISILDGWLPTLQGGEPEQLPGAQVSYNMFSVLGVSPFIGRNFSAEEGQPGGPKVVILSYGLWKRRFAGDPGITGKQILISGDKYNIIGVMPAKFEFPIEPTSQIWTPSQVDATNSCGRDCITLRAFARLKPGVSLNQATADMTLVQRRLEQQFPDIYRNSGIKLVPLQQQLTEDFRPAVLLLFAAVGLVLLIACANVANLLLTRSAGRRPEIAIRTALGASKSRLIRQLLTENILLALVGGLFGVVLGIWGVDLLVSLIPDGLPIIGLQKVGPDAYVLGFTALLSLLTGIVLGFLPLFHFSGSAVSDSLKEGGRTHVGTGGKNVRGLLVISEVAFAFMLLIGAGLLMKSFLRLLNVNAGFNPEKVLTMQLLLPDNRYPEREQITTFYSELLEKVRRLPGVVTVGTTGVLPMGGNYTDTHFQIEGQPADTKKIQSVWFQQVSTNYLQTMGIRILKGRSFTERDGPDDPRVVIVSESLAKKYFPDGNVVGRRLNMNDPQNPVWREIVGVAADVKQFGLDQESPIALYLHQSQSPSRFVTLAVRCNTDPLNLADEIRSQVWSLNKNLAVSSVLTMEQVIASTVSTPRITLILITAFASAALLLAAIGLYGVISYSAMQRTNEIGIRMALGAAKSDVLKMVVGQGMMLALIGLFIGLISAFGLTRLMSSLLFGVSATDPLTFAAILVLLTAVALIASFIPAYRASKLDPMIALRYE
jgi:putative ABC transport system permease protein